MTSLVARKRRQLLSIALVVVANAPPRPAVANAPRAAVADAAARNMPPSALILFGAHWCAPCAGELRNLGEIDAAVSALPPDQAGDRPRIVLAWTDRPLHVAPLPDGRRIEVLAPPVAQALADRSAAIGLPFAVLTDASGRNCVLQRGPLRAAAVAALWHACVNAM